MQAADDSGLLRQYVEQASEEAFGALIERHINKVYSVALRHVANPHQAEEITQAVFTILARKSRGLVRHTCLSGWLYQTARLTSVTYLRSEIRRARREQEAYMQTGLNPTESEGWQQIAPLLDGAIAKLGAKERDAIVLRFFDGKSMKDVGAALALNEGAAKKRVNRAVEKLRKFFAKRGVVSTTAIIAGILSANSVQAAPAVLAKSVTAVAFTKGAAVGGSTLTLIKGALKLMAWTKMKTIGIAGIALLAALGTTTMAIKEFTAPPIEEFFARGDSSFLNKAPAVLIFRPTRYPTSNLSVGGEPVAPGRLMGRGRTVPWLLCDAYGFIPERMVLPPGLPPGKYDFLVTTPGDPRATLRAEIQKQLGLTAHTETKEMDVLLLKTRSAVGPGLKLSRGGEPKVFDDPGKLTVTNFKMSDPTGSVADCFGFLLGIPVVDETGLTDSYDFELYWNEDFDLAKSAGERQVLKRAINEQLGLDLVPARRSIEMLVVEKTN